MSTRKLDSDTQKRKRSIDLSARNKRSLGTHQNKVKRSLDSGLNTKRKVDSNKESKDMFKKDEEFYEECFNSCKDHKCEECGVPLNTQFRDSNGKVISKARYSHILPKSVAPELRHDVENINHLCFHCHQIWEFRDKKSMKIYKKNKEKYPHRLK